jgi:hypothetical protein
MNRILEEKDEVKLMIQDLKVQDPTPNTLVKIEVALINA